MSSINDRSSIYPQEQLPEDVRSYINDQYDYLFTRFSSMIEECENPESTFSSLNLTEAEEFLKGFETLELPLSKELEEIRDSTIIFRDFFKNPEKEDALVYLSFFQNLKKCNLPNLSKAFKKESTNLLRLTKAFEEKNIEAINNILKNSDFFSAVSLINNKFLALKDRKTLVEESDKTSQVTNQLLSKDTIETSITNISKNEIKIPEKLENNNIDKQDKIIEKVKNDKIIEKVKTIEQKPFLSPKSYEISICNLQIHGLDDKNSIEIFNSNFSINRFKDQNDDFAQELLQPLLKKITDLFISQNINQIQVTIDDNYGNKILLLLDPQSNIDEYTEKITQASEKILAAQRNDNNFQYKVVMDALDRSPSLESFNAIKSNKESLEAISQAWLQIVKKGVNVQTFNDKRSGLSQTTGSRTNKGQLAKKCWMETDELVRSWALSKIPLDLDKILGINRKLHETKDDENKIVSLPCNGGEPGQLRKESEEIYAGHSLFHYISGLNVDNAMQEFNKWLLNKCSLVDENKESPIVLAAMAYQRLVSIHPFFDGNGRTSRIVMDYILQRYGLPPAALDQSEVAVFANFIGFYGDGDPPVDHVLKLTIQGIKNSCVILGISSPFLNTT